MWNHWDNHNERTNNRVEGDNIDKAVGILQMYELDAREKYLNELIKKNPKFFL